MVKHTSTVPKHPARFRETSGAGTRIITLSASPGRTCHAEAERAGELHCVQTKPTYQTTVHRFRTLPDLTRRQRPSASTPPRAVSLPPGSLATRRVGGVVWRLGWVGGGGLARSLTLPRLPSPRRPNLQIHARSIALRARTPVSYHPPRGNHATQPNRYRTLCLISRRETSRV